MAVDNWTEGALCAQADPDAWFPDKGQQGAGDTKTAKDICKRCPVFTECLADAMDNDDRFGIRAGLTERQRARLRKSA